MGDFVGDAAEDEDDDDWRSIISIKLSTVKLLERFSMPPLGSGVNLRHSGHGKLSLSVLGAGAGGLIRALPACSAGAAGADSRPILLDES